MGVLAVSATEAMVKVVGEIVVAVGLALLAMVATLMFIAEWLK
jgi:hypothetical protein